MGCVVSNKTGDQDTECNALLVAPVAQNNTAKMKKKSIKLSANHKCITVDSIEHDALNKLNATERAMLKIRKDQSMFLQYCSNCLHVGHGANKCPQRCRIFVAGDSHSAFWDNATKYYINSNVVCIRLPGMSAQGLTNKQSNLGCATKIVNAFKKWHRASSSQQQPTMQYLFVQIGQVDVDYVWYYRQMKHGCTGSGCTFEQQIELSINNLFKFLSDELLCHHNAQQTHDNNLKVVVHGIHLPPLNDCKMRQKLYDHFMNRSKMSKEYLDEHLRLPSHAQRSQMVLQFNDALQQKCKEYGFYFVQIANDIMDRNSGIVQTKFMKQNDEVSDIHLDPQALIPVYHQKFKQLNFEFAHQIESVWSNIEDFKTTIKQRFEET